MTKRERNVFYAKRWRRVAEKNYKRDIKYWSSFPLNDEMMKELIKNDLSDHLHGISLLRVGKVRQAFDFASDFDTASRDDIPKTVWNYMYRVAYPEDAQKRV